MADIHDLDDQMAKRRGDLGTEGPTFDQGTRADQDSAPDYPSSLLGDARLNNRGNAPVKAAVMQRLQQTHGNRAVQRYLQRSADTGASAVEEAPLGERIRSKSGGGSSLDPGVQRTLESGIGAPMSNVKVHTDGEADTMARSVDAVAFTTGNDIFFQSGMYNPGSDQGMRLLAHEATHTVQQSQGPVSGTPAPGGVSISDPSDSYEQAAEASAANVLAGKSAPASAQRTATSGAPVQRAEDDEEVATMRTSTYNSTPVQRAEDDEEVATMRTSTYNSTPVQRAEDDEEVATMRTSTYNSTPVQRAEDDEEVATMRTSTYNSTPVQRAEDDEEVATMRTSTYNSAPVQRAAQDEEEMQTMRTSTYNSTPVQRAEDDEEVATMRTSTYNSTPVQRAEDDEEVATMRTSTYNSTPVQRHGDEDEGA